MIIKSIDATNLDILYSYVQLKKENGTNRMPIHISSLLRRSCITIDFSDLSIFELLQVKKLASNTKYKLETGDYNIPFIEELKSVGLDSDFSSTLKRFENTNSCKTDLSILPIGSIKFSAICVFQGSSLLSLTGFDIESVFTIHNSNISLEENFKNNIFQNLWKKIYDGWRAIESDHDLIVDSMIYTQYYKDMPKDDVGISQIFDNRGRSLNFIGVKMDEFNQKHKEFVSVSLDNREIYAEFTCYTTLLTYLKIQLGLKSSEYLADHMDFLQLFMKNKPRSKEVYDFCKDHDILDLLGNFQQIEESIINSNKKEIDFFSKCLLLSGDSLITFSLILPVKNIELLDLFDDNFKSLLNENKSDIFYTEFHKIESCYDLIRNYIFK